MNNLECACSVSDINEVHWSCFSNRIPMIFNPAIFDLLRSSRTSAYPLTQGLTLAPYFLRTYSAIAATYCFHHSRKENKERDLRTAIENMRALQASEEELEGMVRGS
jgi:hypothetical protein